MPARDKTGPEGAGAMTGRGMGQCSGTPVTGRGMGLGRGRGMGCGTGRGRGCGMGGGRVNNSFAADQEITMLRHEVEMLKEKLNS